MFKILTTKAFDKAFKVCKKRGYPMEKLQEAVRLLQSDGNLPLSYKPHKLHGNHEGEWEAHIAPDWLLTWMEYENELTLLLLSTGTHSDLFGKKKK